MSARSWIVCALAGLVLASPAAAQQPTEPEKGREPGERRAGSGDRERRGDGGRRGGIMAAMADPTRYLDELAVELNLSEQQKKQVAELFEAHKAKTESMREAYRLTDEEREQQRALAEEMRAALEADDKEKIEDIRKRVADSRAARSAKIEPVRKQIEESTAKLREDVSQLLTAEQKPKFDAFWSSMMVRGAYGGPVRNPRALKSVVDGLGDLSSEQKEQLEGLFRTFHESERNLRQQHSARGNRGGAAGAAEGENAGDPRRNRRESSRALQAEMQQLAEKLHQDVMNVLTEAQRAKVEEMLKGQSGRMRRGPRPDRGDDGARPAGQKPAPDKG